jgi:hypothetical protein
MCQMMYCSPKQSDRWELIETTTHILGSFTASVPELITRRQTSEYANLNTRISLLPNIHLAWSNRAAELLHDVSQTASFLKGQELKYLKYTSGRDYNKSTTNKQNSTTITCFFVNLP